MKKYFAIIGVGNLGGFYVKSLAEYDGDAVIQIIDQSEDAINRTKKLFDEMIKKAMITLEVCSDISELNEHIDIVAVVTSSKSRRKIVETLLKTKKIDYMILEKVLFPCIEDYDIVGKLLQKKKVKTWVNCTRRLQPSYEKVREFFKDEKNITYRCSGGSWGLACNTVHQIDAMCYFTGGDEGLVVSSEGLYPKYIESKRSGYIEFFGTLEGKTDYCQYFAISAEENAPAETMMIIQSEHKICVIKEAELKIQYASVFENWKWKEWDMIPLYQSQITAPLFEEILRSGNCKLPDYETAAKEHIPFINAINKYLYRVTGKEYESCPIT